ncbi:hypothetical protein CDD81_3411 [Ophiocordyceps australis]|uniref:[histone H3]-trimethyl-L-lysine(9) demethylase n=1 Tax=Ophiocordyceps australis TaxID=1399860 RepID=A0A2C5XS55_9HYPO|nr:hypothetical protein CDD81_3411 [Ophiocordyceps australis]
MSDDAAKAAVAAPASATGFAPSSGLAAAHGHGIDGATSKPPAPVFLHSPPDSNNAAKSDASDSELSDLEDEPVLDGLPPIAPVAPPLDHDAAAIADKRDKQRGQSTDDEQDVGLVLPDHWSGAVPVFCPTLDQFKDFQRFMTKVDSYGMKSGIIKIIPPRQWKDAQPDLDQLVKRIKVREPIKQDIMGSNGTYRQVNILHGRSYNLPQWRQLCEQSEHQPPARRGQRRANADKPRSTRRTAAARPCKPAAPRKRTKGRLTRSKYKQSQDEDDEDRPMTPVSPKTREAHEQLLGSIEVDSGDDDGEVHDCKPSAGGSRQSKPKTQSVSARRKLIRREGSAMIDEAAFRDFDYRMDTSEYTPERCEELERAYWKTLTYAAPLYGADLMGTLFDDRTTTWNLNKLPNLLDVLGTKVPGVNTAYLYLGMWKATFAWHLEDVDLYSINYLHFGAPKQWYSISQADARRFEAAMKSVWPADAKACDQFLRHKGFLISPHHLLQHYGIKVNKVVSYPGEFVVTYPYGYHSGYNLGYNCAEAVNFALDTWLPMGKIAKKCECAQAQDSVWINVYEIERKLRGEETEYEETEEEEDDEDEDEDGEVSGLPTPPAAHGPRLKDRKRKRAPAKGAKVKVKRIKLRLKAKVEPPCCLCPHDMAEFSMMATDDGRKAHRLCALYIPETYIDTIDGKEVVCNVPAIHKDRLDLKCLFCRSKRGACFQCSHKKCARAYHATCAAAAGVFVEEQDVPVFGQDGTEFKEQAFEFSCRFHRTRRDRKLDGEALEADGRIRTAAQAVDVDQVCQFQYHKGDIFAGFVLENRRDEQTLLVSIIPNGERVEMEYKWLLLADAADYRLPKASAKALAMPTSRKAKDQLNAKRVSQEKPRKDEMFVDGYTWAEFQAGHVSNKDQTKVDFAKADQIWYYLGKTSTEARAQYTENPRIARHNTKGNFLDSIPKPPRPIPALKPAAFGQRSYGVGCHAYSTAVPAAPQRPEKPYVYKPRKPLNAQGSGQPAHSSHMFVPAAARSVSTPVPTAPRNDEAGSYLAPRIEPLNSGVGGFAATPHAATPHAQTPGPAAAPSWKPPPCSRPLPVANSKSVSAQPSRPTWQVHSSVYHRYPFFQVNHNRDPSKYRTPYAPHGGFTNGYEGDLRAHLMSRPASLLRTSTVASPQAAPLLDASKLPDCPAAQAKAPHWPQAAAAASSSMPQMSTAYRGSAVASSSSSPPSSSLHTIVPPQHGPAAPNPPLPQQHMTSRVPIPDLGGQQLHPAIRPQYGLLQQQQQQQAKPQAHVYAQHQGLPQPQQPLRLLQPMVQMQQMPQSQPRSQQSGHSYPRPAPAAQEKAPRAKSTQGPRTYKIPPRQTPVPLPASFLAAIGSASSSAAGKSLAHLTTDSTVNASSQNVRNARAGTKGSWSIGAANIISQYESYA